jgi:4-amino-4-deoxy-L-arabinose transferase-like glycosyltransferase
MTSLAERLQASTIPERIVAAWNAAATRWNPIATIVVAWAALIGPLVFFRGYNSDEGLAVSIARTAIEDGEWLVPHMFNLRWIERPTLLSWLIAAISAPLGGVNQVTARLPIVLFLLAGCLLIYALLRKLNASIPGSLLGVALFLACPLVIRSNVMITADLPLAVLLFLAFFLWWTGYEKGALGFGRWLAIGVVLAFAGLLKGPQPLAYFALGIGCYVLLSRSWRQIPGLAMAGLICALPLAAWYAAIYTPDDELTWAAFMRVHPAALLPGPLNTSLAIVTEMLPAVLMAAACLIAQARGGERVAPAGFVAAAACYAFIAAVIILSWPGGSAPRYYLPMTLMLCVFGGLGYDLLSARRPEIVAPVLLMTAGLLTYALVLSLLSPFLPWHYRQSKIDAARVVALVQSAPAPIYRTADTALNVLPYVPGPILNAKVEELPGIRGPAWMILPIDQADALLARRPEKLHVVIPLGDAEQWRLLRLDR